MLINDDTPGAGEIIRPYPNQPPRRNLGADVPTGRVFAFEGPDGAGKSSQIAALQRHLSARGLDVRVCSFIRNPLIEHSKARGKWDNWDPHTMALTYAASLTDVINRELLPHVRDVNGVVILDRYLYSIISRSEVRGCDRDWLSGLVAPAAVPHHVIHVRTNVEECFARKHRMADTFSYWECGIDHYGHDGLRTAGPVEQYRTSFTTYQRAVDGLMTELIAVTPHLTVDGARSPDDLASDIAKYVDKAVSLDYPCEPVAKDSR